MMRRQSQEVCEYGDVNLSQGIGYLVPHRVQKQIGRGVGSQAWIQQEIDAGNATMARYASRTVIPEMDLSNHPTHGTHLGGMFLTPSARAENARTRP